MSKSKEFVYVDVRVLKYKVPAGKGKRLHYFPCDAYMVDGDQLAGFTAEEFKSWIYVLSMCARQKTNEPRLNLVHARRNAMLRTSNFVSALKKLQELQAIEIKTDENRAPREEKRREEESREEKNTYVCVESAPTIAKPSAKPAEPKPPLTDSMAVVEQTWANTLTHFKIDRPILERERLKLARMIQQHGELTVRYALLGPRGEKSGPDFDPGQHLSLDRIFNPQKLERFINLGSQWNSKTNRQGVR